MEWLARLTPLWHGVDLTRMLVLGDGRLVVGRWSTSSTSSVLAVAGWLWAVRRLRQRMVD